MHENVIELIYNKSKDNKTLGIKDIDTILENLINEKSLNEYVLSINIQSKRSKSLASYSNYTKTVTLYLGTIELMLKNIETNIFNVNSFEKTFYKNISILQALLHELEHASQEKMIFTENSLEAFIMRLSNLLCEFYQKQLYEYSPEERLAEIKSFEEILYSVRECLKKYKSLVKLIEIEKSQRLLRGYHLVNNMINSPLIYYFKNGKKEDLLKLAFSWYNDFDKTFNEVRNTYDLNKRLKYGLPISINEYSDSVFAMVHEMSTYFKNRTNIIL